MNTFAGYGIYDVRGIRENRKRFIRPNIQDLERANSFYCPAGRWASRGWILMGRSDYNKINKYSDALELVISDSITLHNISIVQAQCVTYGLSSDSNAIYLVELTDDRGLLFNKWFQFPITSYYNIRSPGYENNFYASSLNNGVPWTWSGMLRDIWNQMSVLDSGGVLNTWPGLPSTPTGIPEGFWFPGVSAWPALNDILDYLGMTVVCDLTKSSAFTIVNSGVADSSFTSKQTSYLPNKEDDLEWIDIGAGRVPASVIVIFRRRNDFYGSEETVRLDSLQWAMTPLYEVTISAPVTFTGAVGLDYIWSDFTVRYDQNGNPLAADVTTANTIAQERVRQYYAKIYRTTLGFMTQTYTKALPFVTGSQVDGVLWYQDYKDQDREAWKTQIVRGAYPPWPDLWDD